MKIIVIPFNSIPILINEPKKNLNHIWLHDQVNGYLESVTLPNSILLINEEGKLQNLPYNKVASELFRIINTNDVIVGNAVLVGPVDNEGNFTQIPQDIIDHVMDIWNAINN